MAKKRRCRAARQQAQGVSAVEPRPPRRRCPAIRFINEHVVVPMSFPAAWPIEKILHYKERLARGEPVALERTWLIDGRTEIVHAAWRVDPVLLKQAEAERRRLRRGGGRPKTGGDALSQALRASGARTPFTALRWLKARAHECAAEFPDEAQIDKRLIFEVTSDFIVWHDEDGFQKTTPTSELKRRLKRLGLL
jgi:hypothetical protein